MLIVSPKRIGWIVIRQSDLRILGVDGQFHESIPFVRMKVYKSSVWALRNRGGVTIGPMPDSCCTAYAIYEGDTVYDDGSIYRRYHA